MNLGETAYNAYQNYMKTVFDLGPHASFDDIRSHEQHAWAHAAAMVMTEVLNQKTPVILTEREQQEVYLANTYVADFNHGTSGHLAYTVIDKLSHALHANLVPIREEEKPDGK